MDILSKKRNAFTPTDRHFFLFNTIDLENEWNLPAYTYIYIYMYRFCNNARLLIPCVRITRTWARIQYVRVSWRCTRHTRILLIYVSIVGMYMCVCVCLYIHCTNNNLYLYVRISPGNDFLIDKCARKQKHLPVSTNSHGRIN